jgi:hypothetical protein
MVKNYYSPEGTAWVLDTIKGKKPHKNRYAPQPPPSFAAESDEQYKAMAPYPFLDLGSGHVIFLPYKALSLLFGNAIPVKKTIVSTRQTWAPIFDKKISTLPVWKFDDYVSVFAGTKRDLQKYANESRESIPIWGGEDAYSGYALTYCAIVPNTRVLQCSDKYYTTKREGDSNRDGRLTLIGRGRVTRVLKKPVDFKRFRNYYNERK